MKKGILLPVFSLPSKYGIGDFGKEAREFINILRDNNIEYWEILPINECGKYPYAPMSYYALNKNYISIDLLIEEGLLDIRNVEYRENRNKIKYDNFKDKWYKEAYVIFRRKYNEYKKDYEEFISKIEIQEFCNFYSKLNNENVDYISFLQFILDKQWKLLKEYANSRGVKIIGDLPIYPCFNSAEVEYNSACYDLKDGKMEYVSGASPDYFNNEGQKWGHPLYNFEYMKKHGYEYLLRRYKEFLNRYDVIRIDHFRAFDTYYKIPVDKSAKHGFYADGPREDFLDKLFTFATSDRFIVEDLGDIREETEELRDKYNFTKMKILQYTINLEKQIDEYKNSKNMVVYTGNHDNNTILGWYDGLSPVEQEKLIKFLENNNIKEEKINVAMIKYALKSNARYVIIPVQDILGLGEEARINIPGDENGERNWTWKLMDFEDLKKKISIMK